MIPSTLVSTNIARNDSNDKHHVRGPHFFCLKNKANCTHNTQLEVYYAAFLMAGDCEEEETTEAGAA